KFEFTSMDEPYSGVAQAFGQLCNRLADTDTDDDASSPEETMTAKMSNVIMDTMKEEAGMLMRLIPEINIFFDESSYKTPDGREDAASGNDHERWRHAFRKLTQIFGSHASPIVMVLDDIQWADVASLDIMDSLISDVQNPHPLMIVGCYRSNEVDENSILYNRIRTLEQKQDHFAFHVTNIKVGSFDVNAVNEMIMSMLSMEIEEESNTLPLAELCHKRTLGNPFFLIEFMRMLKLEGLIDFKLGLMEWVWNLESIEAATMSTANVVELLQTRMRKLSKDEQVLLQYAACLGSTFSTSNLYFIWEEHALANSHSTNPDVLGMLEKVKDAMLIESCGEFEHRWVHDKVQEAALSLSDLVNPSFQFEIGYSLYQGLRDPELDAQLFVVVDLINRGSLRKRPDLSALNLRAARKARKIAAFQSGAKYASFGIELLPSDPWTVHQELVLELYSLSAEMELMLGHIDIVEERIQTVVDRDEFTTEQLIRLKFIKMSNLYSVEPRFDEAVQYGIHTLKDMGYSFLWPKPLLPLQMLAELFKTIKKLKALPTDHFVDAPLMKDRKNLAIVTMLSKTHHAAYNAGSLPINFICQCKAIEMSLKYGPSDLTATKLAAVNAAWMYLKDDHETCSYLDSMTFATQKRFGIRNSAETYHTGLGFVQAYMKPLHEILQPSLHGYIQGLKDGEIEDTMLCLTVRFQYIPYITGTPLPVIMEKFSRVAAQLEESKRTKELWSFRAWWKMMQKLQLPFTETAKEIVGEDLKVSREERTYWHDGNENFAVGELLLFFGLHEERLERLLGTEKGKSFFDTVIGYFPGRIDTFHRGIVWYAMARRTGKRKYQSEANKIRAKIASWVKAGDPNVVTYNLFLNAEHAALLKKFDKADKYYKQAIVGAGRTGAIHHAALFNERYAEYRFTVHSDAEGRKHCTEEAIRYYTEWGAIGKAMTLEANMMAW
ncbi:MAG: hypothetical protein SGILL_005466, partial [Bacillariaceae sp.]